MANGVLTHEDLVHFTDREIQMVLREVDTKDLAVAMLGAQEDVNKRYFSNVSERVSNMLRDEMVARGDVPESEIADIQFQILQKVLQLKDAGVIVWPKQEEQPKPTRKLSEEYYKEKEETKTLLAEKSYLDVSCEEIVRVIVCVAEVARAEGILEMAKLIDVDSDDMLSTGMRLAAEGTEPELIVSILDTRKTERHKDVYYVCVCDSRHRAMCASPGQCRTQLSFLGAC